MILILWNWWYYCDSLAVFLQYLGWMSFSYHLAIPKGLLVLVLVIAENFHYILWICSYNKHWYCLHYRQVTIIILQDVFYSNIPTYLEWTEEKVKKSWYIHMAKSKCTWSLDSLLWHKFLYGINWRSCLGFCVITIWLIVRFQVVYDCTLESLIYFSFLFTWFTSAVW